MIKYPSLAAIDGAGYDPEQICKMSFPYEIGRLSVGLLDAAIDRATVDGVTVTHERFGGGIFVKHGRITAQGRWKDVRVLLAALERLAAELDA